MTKKLIFFHDGPRWKNKKGVQFGNSSDIDIYKRYLYLAKQVSFCMRVFPVENTHTLTDLNKNGLFIHEIKSFNRPSKIFNYFNSKQKIHQLVDSADIIIVRLPSTIGSIAYWRAKDKNIPVLVEVVACPHDSLSNHSSLGKIYSKFSVSKLKNIMLDASFSIYVTKRFLQSRYPTLGNSEATSDVVLKKVFTDNPKIKHYNEINLDEITLGTLAAVDVKYKGHDLVIKAISLLKRKGFNIKYLIAGKGNPLRLESLAKDYGVSDRIKFIGLIDHTQINDFFKKIDIYIQPSRTEGLPRALVEAMNFGCACIGSSTGGIPELLEKDVIFKSNSVKDLCDVLTTFDNQNKFKQQSSINFENSKKYEFSYLESKRKNFYDNFLKSINEK